MSYESKKALLEVFLKSTLKKRKLIRISSYKEFFGIMDIKEQYGCTFWRYLVHPYCMRIETQYTAG